MKKKLYIFLISILIIFIIPSVQIFADNNVISIDDILNKVKQLSKFTFLMNMYYIRTFDDSFNSYSPYLVINTKFIYKFSEFSEINIDYNLGENGKIDLDNFDSNNFTSIKINEFSFYENLAKIFNISQADLDFKIGYFTYDSSIINREYQLLDGGYTRFKLFNPLIALHFKYGMISTNIVNLLYGENIIAQLKLNLLNLLNFGFDLYAQKDKKVVYNLQILFKYINFYIYGNFTPFYKTISGVDTLQSNLNFRINYSFDKNFYISAFYDSLLKDSFNGIITDKDFSRTGGEFGFKGNWIEIALSPYYILSSKNFYVDGFIKIKLVFIYVEISSNHSSTNSMETGYFLKVGAEVE